MLKNYIKKLIMRWLLTWLNGSVAILNATLQLLVIYWLIHCSLQHPYRLILRQWPNFYIHMIAKWCQSCILKQPELLPYYWIRKKSYHLQTSTQKNRATSTYPSNSMATIFSPSALFSSTTTTPQNHLKLHLQPNPTSLSHLPIPNHPYLPP